VTTLRLGTGPSLELDEAGLPLGRPAVRRRGLLVIGRRLLEERRRDVALGRTPCELGPYDVEALYLALADEAGWL
jgi:hypothetical protein